MLAPYGVLMQLTQEEIEQTYSESSVRAYCPETVVAELKDGERVPALCFNLIVPPGPEEANAEYAGRLRALAHQLGLPADYVETYAEPAPRGVSSPQFQAA